MAHKPEGVKLAERLIKVLDKKARAGRRDPSWQGYENGYGTEVGTDIEKLIAAAKRMVRRHYINHPD